MSDVLGFSDASKKLSMSGSTLAEMNRKAIESIVGPNAAIVIYNKITLMKQEKMCKELGDENITPKEIGETFLDSVFERDDIVPETIQESLDNAGFKDTTAILNSCKDELNSEIMKTTIKNTGMSEDEACAVFAYTYEAKPNTEDSPYRILNKALLEKNVEQLKKLRGYIFNLLSGLRRIKGDFNDRLYRGIDGKWLKGDQNNFKIGDRLVFAPFTSTSLDEKVALSFINKSDTEVPILYEINGKAQGYFIDDFSNFKKEKGKPQKH